MSDTDTPRTDELYAECMSDDPYADTELEAFRDFARALERENRRLRAALEQAAAYIKVFSSGTPNGKVEKLKRAIGAALAGEDANCVASAGSDSETK